MFQDSGKKQMDKLGSKEVDICQKVAMAGGSVWMESTKEGR